MRKPFKSESIDEMSREDFVHDLAVEIVNVMMDVDIMDTGNGYTRAKTDDRHLKWITRDTRNRYG